MPGPCKLNAGVRLEGYSLAPGFRATYGAECDLNPNAGEVAPDFKFILNGEGRYGFPQTPIETTGGDEVMPGKLTSKPRYGDKEGDWRMVRDFQLRFAAPVGDHKKGTFTVSFGAYDPIVTVYGSLPGMEKLMPRSGAYVDRQVNTEGRGELGGYIAYDNAAGAVQYGAMVLMMNGRPDSKMFLGFTAKPGDSGRETTWHQPDGPSPFLSGRAVITPLAYVGHHGDDFEFFASAALSINTGNDPEFEPTDENTKAPSRTVTNPRANLGVRVGPEKAAVVAAYDLSVLMDSANPGATLGNRFELTTSDFAGKGNAKWFSGRPFFTVNSVHNPNGYEFDQGSVVFDREADLGIANADDIPVDGAEPSQTFVEGQNGTTVTLGAELAAKVKINDASDVKFRLTPEVQYHHDSRVAGPIWGGGVAVRADFKF